MTAEPVAVIVRNVSKEYRISREKYFKNLSDIFSGKKPSKDENRPKSVLALDNISFEIARGESFGIIGKNGAGKSTLLKILSGVTHPSSGIVRLHGKLLSILNIGTGFHPDLTGRENVFFSGTLLGMKKPEISRSFPSIVEFSGIGKFIDEPVKHYSDGMYLRLAFSTIIHLNADILVFDEVLSVGDISFQEKCMEKLLDLKKSDTTLIMVSHNLNQISRFCDKLALFENGRIRTISENYEVVRKYTLDHEADRKNIRHGIISRDGIIGERDQPVVIRHIRTLDEAGEEKNKFFRSKSIMIETVYEQTVREAELDIGLTISDIFDNILFGDVTVSIDENPRNEQGTYQVRWLIPSGVLNQGTFKVNVYAIQSGTEVINHYLHILNFEVIEENPTESEIMESNFKKLPIKVQTSITRQRLTSNPALS